MSYYFQSVDEKRSYKIIEMSNLNCWPNAVNSCPTIIFGASTGTTIPIISKGVEIPSGTFIPDSSTTVPNKTVTVIKPLLNILSFQGNINVDNGFLTVPTSGQYLASSSAYFSNIDITFTEGDNIALYLYKVDHYSQPQGLVTLIAKSTAVPIPPIYTAYTCLSLSFIVDLKGNDRIFFAVTQLTQTGDIIDLNLSSKSSVQVRRIC